MIYKSRINNETNINEIEHKNTSTQNKTVYNEPTNNQSTNNKTMQIKQTAGSTQKQVNKEDEKNTAILVTGSIFIVLSAIIFLTSTWSIIPNLIKTLTLVVLTGVFLGASKIAKNVFKLEQTSKAFYFITMTYIPI